MDTKIDNRLESLSKKVQTLTEKVELVEKSFAQYTNDKLLDMIDEYFSINRYKVHAPNDIVKKLIPKNEAQNESEVNELIDKLNREQLIELCNINGLKFFENQKEDSLKELLTNIVVKKSLVT